MKFTGITDFMNPMQVREMIGVMESIESERKLGVGVMMSYKTLHGLPTKWYAAFPKNEDVERVFLEHERVFNVLHYADPNDDSSGKDFLKAALLGGKNIHAVQFDMTWPNISDIQYMVENVWRERGLSLKIIIQIGTRAIRECENNPEKVAEKVFEYFREECVDYVLIDKSMGRGKEMDAEELLRYVHEIKNYFGDYIEVIVAGGLGPFTANLVEPIFIAYNDISTDAQGKLRPSGSALDPIDWKMATDYLIKIDGIYRRYIEEGRCE